MRGILIDPRLQRVTDVELSDKNMLADMRRLIGCETMGQSVISDQHDSIWCDDTILARGNPCFGFKLGPKDRAVTLGGICIIIGADDRGETREPYIPIEMVQNDIDWLGEIVPEVIWIEDKTTVLLAGLSPFRRHTAVVTYSRVRKR